MLQKNDLVIITSIPSGRDISTQIIGTNGRITHIDRSRGAFSCNVELNDNPAKVRKIAAVPFSCVKKVERPRYEKAVPNPLNTEIRNVRAQLKKEKSPGNRVRLHGRLSYLLSQSREGLI